MNDKLIESKAESNSSDYHFHRRYELIYVSEGSVSIYCGCEKLTVSQDRMVIIPPFTPHKIFSCTGNIKTVYFCKNYLSKYLSAPTVHKLTSRFGGKMLISDKNIQTVSEEIEAISEDIISSGGENSYLYLYRLISSSYKITNAESREKNKTLEKILDFIDAHAYGSLTLETIAAQCSLSRFHICRLLRAELDITPVSYITFVKMRAAASMLESGNSSISEISVSLSFSSPKYFTKIFKKTFGLTPSAYRKSADISQKSSYPLNLGP